jgi:queuine tRNA-ribosyltransferase
MTGFNCKSDSIRQGKLITKSGAVSTPFFMPIATKGSVKHIDPSEIKEIGFELILGNTYHLWLRPGDKLIKKAGGLHDFMNWHGSILTDSGGFQVFSLGARAKDRFGLSGVKLTEQGVEFKDHLNGAHHFLSPEKSIDIQLNLNSDIIMCLDECPPYPCTKQAANKSLEITTAWARRCKDHFLKKVKNKTKRPLLFGIIQGSNYEELREKSAKQLLEIGFDGFAIGGVAVGEPREKLHKILNWVTPLLPADKPRYLMGLGKPEEIVAAVVAGVDMFDCVIPTREGRHGRLFVWKRNSAGKVQLNLDEKKKLNKRGDFYDTINIAQSRFKEDMTPVDKYCSCDLCNNYSRAYLRHLFAVGEPLGFRLASIHNLTFYWQLMKKLRTS